jgi:hypothetical protein
LNKSVINYSKMFNWPDVSVIKLFSSSLTKGQKKTRVLVSDKPFRPSHIFASGANSLP